MKSKITREHILIRTKELKSGNKSIYLECNHEGERIIEWLHLYLVPETCQADIEQNELTMLAAQNIRANRYAEGARKPGPPLPIKKNKDILLTDYIRHYAEGLQKRGYKSADKRLYTLITRIQEVDANIRLKDVNRIFAERFYNNLKTRTSSLTGKTFTKKTISGLYSAFGKIMRVATAEGKANFIVIPFYENNVGRKSEERNALTFDELQKLINTPCKNEITRRAFLFSCATGLRWGDIVSLKWKELVEHDDNLFLEKLQQKTGKYVYLPLNKLALSVIPKERGGKEDYVFKSYKDSQTYGKYLKEWVENAGIKNKNIVFYSGRHTFATLQYEMGADLDVTRKTMGHTAIESTTAYTHILDKKKIEVTDRINSLFEDRLKRRIVWCEKKK